MIYSALLPVSWLGLIKLMLYAYKNELDIPHALELKTPVALLINPKKWYDNTKYQIYLTQVPKHPEIAYSIANQIGKPWKKVWKSKSKIITASVNTVLKSMHENIRNKEFNVFNKKNTMHKTKLINNIVLHVWLKRMVLDTCPPV